MKKIQWILLSGLLVAATSVAQAQAPVTAPQSAAGQTSADGSATAANVDAGGITNTTTTTTTTGVPADGSNGSFVPADDAAFGDSASESSMPNTGGEPMIAILAGLSIAGAAVAMRRKVTA